MERKNLLVSAGARSQNVHFFIASCLLATVSWYTTEQGMGLYLSSWLSLFASVGVQFALVFVAWQLGVTKTNRGVLLAVFAIAAMISVSFSYVNLYTWFSVRERPAVAQRELYDAINAASGKTGQLLAAAVSEGQKHALALEDMASVEKKHGHMSQGLDADPYLAAVRRAVVREVETSGRSNQVRGGEGVSYTALARSAKLARQSLESMSDAERSLAANRAQAKPSDSSDRQLRDFRQVYDSVPWNDVEQALHSSHFEKPVLPNYSDFVDHASSGQEDLLLAFKDLFSKPTGRHAFAFLLAAFIDVIVALLAYAAGPVLFGNSERRWFAAGAALDALDSQVFVRDFLRKMVPDPRGMARVEASSLSAGTGRLDGREWKALLSAEPGGARAASGIVRRCVKIGESRNRVVKSSYAVFRFILRSRAPYRGSVRNPFRAGSAGSQIAAGSCASIAFSNHSNALSCSFSAV